MNDIKLAKLTILVGLAIAAVFIPAGLILSMVLVLAVGVTGALVAFWVTMFLYIIRII